MTLTRLIYYKESLDGGNKTIVLQLEYNRTVLFCNYKFSYLKVTSVISKVKMFPSKGFVQVALKNAMTWELGERCYASLLSLNYVVASFSYWIYLRLRCAIKWLVECITTSKS